MSGSVYRLTFVGVDCSECGRRHEFNGEQLAVSKGRWCVCGALVVPPASVHSETVGGDE